MTKCPECSDTGERDSGGMHPWGESILLPCDCKDAEIGRLWRENSSLEKWFPITAERIVALEAENAALKRDLQRARDGLTKGRTRMREDNERFLHLPIECHTVDDYEANAQPDPDFPCRSDGRCQYAIDHGAEDLGHCPRGRCVMRDCESAP